MLNVVASDIESLNQPFWYFFYSLSFEHMFVATSNFQMLFSESSTSLFSCTYAVKQFNSHTLMLRILPVYLLNVFRVWPWHFFSPTEAMFTLCSRQAHGLMCIFYVCMITHPKLLTKLTLSLNFGILFGSCYLYIKVIKYRHCLSRWDVIFTKIHGLI